MTSQEFETRDQRLIESIETVLRSHQTLSPYASELSVAIEEATIVIRGRLPNKKLKAQLVPAVRKAGALEQVANEVEVVSKQLS